MKNTLITILLLVVIGLLIYLAVPEQQLTQPVPIQTTPEAPTPKASEPERGTPTPKAPEITPTPAGTPQELVFPTNVNFWVNEIKVPETTAYEQGLNYIPIKESNLKTFAGSFGPYPSDPTTNLRVTLCSEFYKVQAAPACENVKLVYQNQYVSFAKGYQYDEYIGGMAAKDYIAYYNVYLKETKVATSNVAVIRTVKD